MKQVFTFGFGHQYPRGYVIVYGATSNECRQIMYDHFGNKWSMQYSDEEQAGVDEYNLRLVGVLGNPPAAGEED